MAAGTIAINRVNIRLTHGRRRMFKNPSMTIWPANVPVNVAFWPDAKSAIANTILAKEAPKTGDSKWYASWISATS